MTPGAGCDRPTTWKWRRPVDGGATGRRATGARRARAASEMPREVSADADVPTVFQRVSNPFQRLPTGYQQVLPTGSNPPSNGVPTSPASPTPLRGVGEAKDQDAALSLRALIPANLEASERPQMHHRDAAGLIPATALSGPRCTLDRTAVLRRFVANPLVALAVIFRIHWRALGLWRKRTRFHPRPEPPGEMLTR
ncbi:MAG: DUF1365 family protein [Alphaproteobacteria bacterium]|nr:DUF1365 family protein [Alphaproteobacteria bacterium]MCW5744238.1 DUF1365 family protein [Alphaproteobacteria bacterium]